MQIYGIWHLVYGIGADGGGGRHLVLVHRNSSDLDNLSDALLGLFREGEHGGQIDLLSFLVVNFVRRLGLIQRLLCRYIHVGINSDDVFGSRIIE